MPYRTFESIYQTDWTPINNIHQSGFEGQSPKLLKPKKPTNKITPEKTIRLIHSTRLKENQRLKLTADTWICFTSD